LQYFKKYQNHSNSIIYISQPNYLYKEDIYQKNPIQSILIYNVNENNGCTGLRLVCIHHLAFCRWGKVIRMRIGKLHMIMRFGCPISMSLLLASCLFWLSYYDWFIYYNVISIKLVFHYFIWLWKYHYLRVISDGYFRD
jgi:hypothetical protein